MWKLKRSFLKDQAAEILREYIVSGQIAPGTKLTERDVAERLGISRMPTRDALMELEKEGIIVSKPDGRYVIELSERDIRELYQIRSALERLAVELATRNTSQENRATLLAKLDGMQEAIAQKDREAFARNDLEIHRLIWKQADNGHLWRMLNVLVGPIFLFIATHTKYVDWHEILEMHEALVTCINAGDVDSAIRAMERNIELGLHYSLKLFLRVSQENELRNMESGENGDAPKNGTLHRK